jgi:hypothetical protein
MDEGVLDKSGTYVMCDVCGFIRSDLSPDNHMRVVHHGLESQGAFGSQEDGC